MRWHLSHFINLMLVWRASFRPCTVWKTGIAHFWRRRWKAPSLALTATAAPNQLYRLMDMQTLSPWCAPTPEQGLTTGKHSNTISRSSQASLSLQIFGVRTIWHACKHSLLYSIFAWPANNASSDWNIEPAHSWKGPIGSNTSFPLLVIGNTAGQHICAKHEYFWY